MLVASIPYDRDKDLGRAYNEAMGRIGEDDWALFLDHDAMFTTRGWHNQIADIVEKNPEAGALTAMTNRVGTDYQIAEGVDWNNHDINSHRRTGRRLQKKHSTAVKDITWHEPLSGVVIVLSKRAWRQIHEFKHGFLGVDNRMHYDLRDAGFKVYLMTGVYVYHWYRGDDDKGHLSGARVADQGKYAKKRR